MHRRALLATIGTGLTGLGGCLTGATLQPPGESDQNTDDPGTDTPTDSHTPDGGGVTGPGDRFDDAACPALLDHVGTHQCYHATDVDDADLVLEPSHEVFDPAADGDALRFELANRGAHAVQFNPYGWSIYRRDTDGGWTKVAPDLVPQPIVTVAPGDQFTWVLPTSATADVDDQNEQPISASLDAGVYAFAVDVSRGASQTDTDTVEPTRVGLVALFELTAAVEPPASDGDDDGDIDE